MSSKRRVRRVGLLRQYRRGCHYKVAYATVEDAKPRYFEIAEHDPDSDRLYIYRCPICQQCHIGHRRKG